jgi:hypothetical protein
VRYGPYAVLNDWLKDSPLAVATPAWPANGSFINQRRPNFNWIGVTTNTAVMLGSATYVVEYSPDQDFAGAVTLSTPVVVNSTMDFTADGAVVPGADLADVTTYYWRVRLKTALNNYAYAWSTGAFFTDFTTPTLSGFQVQSSTGGVFPEAQVLTLTAPATAQMEALDSGSGLAVSSLPHIAFGRNYSEFTTPYGVEYTTNAGANWIDGAWEAGAIITGAQGPYCFAVFGDMLYSGDNNGKIYRTADGVTWTVVNGNTALGGFIASMAVHAGRIFAGTNGGKVYVSADGDAWVPVNGDAALGGQINALLSNGRLYAASADGRIYASDNDGNNWTIANNGAQVTDSCVSLALYGGRMYMGDNAGKFFVSQDGNDWTLASTLTPNSVVALGVYSGRLYAGLAVGRVYYSYNGINWTINSGGEPVTSLTALLSFNGKLYAAGPSQGAVTSDGISWRKTVGMGLSSARAMIAFKGKLYAGTTISNIPRVYTPVSAFLGGADRTTDAQTLAAQSLALAQSTNTQTCGGAA